MQPDLLTRLSAVMRKVGWTVKPVPMDLELIQINLADQIPTFFGYENDIDNARAIVLMQIEIEKRFAKGDEFSWHKPGVSPCGLFIATTLDGKQFHQEFYGKTHAICVALAFIQVVGE
jgi:hypothetical protein